MKGVRIAALFLLRFKWRVTAALAVVLVAALGLYSLSIYQRQISREEPVISVTIDKFAAGSLSHSLLDGLEGLQVLYEGAYYASVPLGSALEKIDAMPTSGERMICISEKGEALPIAGLDLIDPGAVYLAYRSAGKTLSVQQGGPYLLLIFNMDGTSQAMQSLRHIHIEPQQ